jgi:hypothetical protein
MSRATVGPPNGEVPAHHREPAPTTTTTVDNAKSNGHGRLRSALDAAGGSLKSLTVLSPQNDPYRVDTDIGNRNGEWLANTLDRLGVTGQRHLRGLHYILIGEPKPNGLPYTNTDEDWLWLGMCAKAARWLKYLPFSRIIDQRNDEPEILPWSPSSGQPVSYVSVNFDINTDVVKLPSARDLTPRVGMLDFGADQPHHLVLVGEKSSLRPVLGGIAQRYRADLFLPTGEISDTQLYAMAKAGAADGRPMVVLYFSDCDPSGWQMPISVSQKLRALKEIEFHDLEFAVQPVGLNPDQVREYGLPSTPLKQDLRKDGRKKEQRADAWVAAMGVEQTEIDALAALRPDLLRQIADDAIAPFYDHTLARRVADAKREWLAIAQQAVDEQAADHLEQIHADVIPELEAKRDEIQQILASVQEVLNDVRVDASMFELPPKPPVPQPVIDYDSQPEPLCSSRWDFVEQCRRLIAAKNYTDGELGEK